MRSQRKSLRKFFRNYKVSKLEEILKIVSINSFIDDKIELRSEIIYPSRSGIRSKDFWVSVYYPLALFSIESCSKY